MVVVSKNPVHSVLFLVLAFVNGSALLFLLDSEFLAILLIVVYVGAIAVLFLFVCMMLNVRFEDKQEVISYIPISGICALILISQLSFLVYSSYRKGTLVEISYLDWSSLLDSTNNLTNFSIVLLSISITLF